MSTHITLALEFVEVPDPMSAEQFERFLCHAGWSKSELVPAVWIKEDSSSSVESIKGRVRDEIKAALQQSNTIQLIFYVVQVGNAAPVHESMSLRPIEESSVRFTR